MKPNLGCVWALLPLLSFVCVSRGQTRPVRHAHTAKAGGTTKDSPSEGKGSFGAEPQASSGTVQVPRDVVPALPVPRLVRFGGVAKDELGKPRTGMVGITFAIYKEQEGGAPLWMETQNVELDEQGRYMLLLGATKKDGLPLELFAAGEQRWLGVQVNLPHEVEQPRVLLVSVPYALKAADTDTLGGKPLSSFLLAPAGSDQGAGAHKTPSAGDTSSEAERLNSRSQNARANRPVFSSGSRQYSTVALGPIFLPPSALTSHISGSGAGLTIIPKFDASIDAATQTVINNAIAFYQNTFTNNITVNIEFHAMSNGLGQSTFFLFGVPYATYCTALAANATSPDDAIAVAHTPCGANNPVTNSMNINVKSPTGRAVGINLPEMSFPANSSCPTFTGSACIGLNVTLANSVGVLLTTVEHEIDEVLGLGSALHDTTTPTDPWTEDLFRWAGQGSRSFAANPSNTNPCTNTPAAFLSMDGGTTDLDDFNNCNNGGDYGDWITHTPSQVQDAFVNGTGSPSLSATSPEVRALDVIGYSITAVGGGGTQNSVAKFDATGTNVSSSSIFETGTNVGIGTASPARSLHIRSAAPTIRLEDSTIPNSFWELQQSAFVNDTFGFLRYENGSAVKDKSFVVSSAGNLGIGTGTPQRKLHIRSSAPVIRLEDSTLPNSFWELQQSAFFVDTFGFLRYENGAAVPSKSFVMSSAGNFGIGSAAPTEKLEVAGNMKINGVLSLAGPLQITGAGSGIIVQSADGTRCRQIGIDNTGSFLGTAVPCGPVRTTPDKFAYVVNGFCASLLSASGCVSTYSINGTTGALTSSGSPALASSLSSAIAVDPLGRFVYVANHGSDDVSMYTINSATGSLTPIGTSTAPAGSLPSFVAVHPSGKFAYVVNDGGTITVYSINGTTGALTPSMTVAEGSQPNSIGMHPSGNFAYVADSSPSVSTYAVDTTTGALTLIDSANNGLFPSAVVVHPSGKFAYAVHFSNNLVSVFAIDAATGKLTPTSTASTRLSPSSVAMDPLGTFAYVANQGANNVTAYSINAATGALAEVGTFNSGSQPVWVAVEHAGKFAYVVNASGDLSCLTSSSSVSAFAIDRATGSLTSVGKVCVDSGAMVVTSGPIP